MDNDESIVVLEKYTPRANESPSIDDLPSWMIDWRTQKPSNRQAEPYADYLAGRKWNWQLPNPEGTITVGGTLLAAIQSIHVVSRHKVPGPYTISLEVRRS